MSIMRNKIILALIVSAFIYLTGAFVTLELDWFIRVINGTELDRGFALMVYLAAQLISQIVYYTEFD